MKIKTNYLKITRMLLAISILCIVFLVTKGCKEVDSFKDKEEIGNEQALSPMTRSGVELSWNYPVKPGMATWYSLQTEDERIAVLQVPEHILATISSEEVVGLCIELPAFFLFTAFNTPQEGFDTMLERYNILRYILTRNDLGSSLIAAYKDASLSGFRTLPYSDEFWSIKLLYFELLLSQKEILRFMTPDEKLELITEARLKFLEKTNNEKFSSLPGLLFSLKIMASILNIEEYEEFIASPKKEAITKFINTGWWFEEVPPIDEIYRITDNYINAKSLQ